MADTIKIPGIGPLEKKYAIIGAASVAGFVGYAYWRNRQAAAAGDTTSTDTTDTSGLSDAQSAADDWGFAYGDSGDGGYAYGGGSPVYQSPSGGSFPTPTGGSPTTDAEWNQAAYEALTDRGVESTAASHALSRYQANLCVTDTEADLVRQAISAVGDTPQTHHNIQICPPSGTGDSGSGTKLAAPSGFHITGTDKSGVSMAWNPLTGALGYHIKITGGGLNHTVITHNTTYRVGSLKKSTSYTFYVMGYNGAGTGAESSHLSAKTKSR